MTASSILAHRPSLAAGNLSSGRRPHPEQSPGHSGFIVSSADDRSPTPRQSAPPAPEGLARPRSIPAYGWSHKTQPAVEAAGESMLPAPHAPPITTINPRGNARGTDTPIRRQIPSHVPIREVVKTTQRAILYIGYFVSLATLASHARLRQTIQPWTDGQETEGDALLQGNKGPIRFPGFPYRGIVAVLRWPGRGRKRGVPFPHRDRVLQRRDQFVSTRRCRPDAARWSLLRCPADRHRSDSLA
jgi:hypothetical protein